MSCTESAVSFFFFSLFTSSPKSSASFAKGSFAGVTFAQNARVVSHQSSSIGALVRRRVNGVALRARGSARTIHPSRLHPRLARVRTPRARRTTDRSRVRLASTRVVRRRVSRRDVPIRNHAERDRSRLSRDLRATPRARRETRRRARLGRGDAPKTRSSAIYVDEVTADVKVDVRATENADARETRVERARSVDTFTRERRRRDRGRRAIVARNDRVNITRSIRRRERRRRDRFQRAFVVIRASWRPLEIGTSAR